MDHSNNTSPAIFSHENDILNFCSILTLATFTARWQRKRMLEVGFRFKGMHAPSISFANNSKRG